MRGAISKEIDVVAGLHAKHQTGRLTESRAFVVAFWDERGPQRVTNSNKPRPRRRSMRAAPKKHRH
jgi:hypothetical protein